MTPKQISLARYLLNANGLDKEEAVLSFTDGRTTHLTEMTSGEFSSLINMLQGETPKDRMTKKILSMAHEMGWETPDGKADISRINAWATKYTKHKAGIDKIPEKELAGVVSVFEKVYLSFLKGI